MKRLAAFLLALALLMQAVPPAAASEAALTDTELAAAAALAGKGLDPLPESLGIQGNAVPNPSEVRQDGLPGRDGGKCNTRHFEGKSFVERVQVRLVFPRAGCCKGDSGKEDGDSFHEAGH